jgi:hypothetical protein
MKEPDRNPKTRVGSRKVPLHLVPPSAKHYLAQALADGAAKYGAYNWRDEAISVSVYKAAAERHWDAFWDGEDLAADSQVHHIAHAMACCAILLDALSLGLLHDDRPTRGAAARLQTEFAARVAGLPTGIVPHAIAAAILRDVAESDDPAPHDGRLFTTVNQNTGD